MGEAGVIALLAGTAGLGGVPTLIIIPEARGRSLEEINEEGATPSAAYAMRAGVAD